jgi:hypothetical protein
MIEPSSTTLCPLDGFEGSPRRSATSSASSAVRSDAGQHQGEDLMTEHVRNLDDVELAEVVM